MATHIPGTLLRITTWASSQLVLLASAHQDGEQWARLASISFYVVWLASGVWLVLTELNIVLSRPGLVAIPPFLPYMVLVTLSEAGLTEAIAISPTAVNIWTAVVLEWHSSHATRSTLDSRRAQYRY